MARFFSHTTLLCLLLLLTSCREEALISPKDLQFLQQGILTTTWTENYIRHTEQVDTLYINQGETVLFTAGYSLNGTTVSQDSAINLYNSHYWEIEGDTIGTYSAEYQFDSVGYHTCVLKTVDFAGDTLKDTVHIFVGTPLKISLVTPPLQSSVEPLSSDYIELNWDVSGIDPWEKSECVVYAAVSDDIPIAPSTRWIDILDSVSFLDANDCKSGIRLKGPLISELWLQNYGINLRDSSLTIYWGVKATAYTSNGFQEVDTDVSAFNTLFLGGDSSIIQIKPVYTSLVTGTSISTKIVLLSALGDTLKSLTYDTPGKPLNIKVKPQSGLRIYAFETKQTDYEANPVTIDVPARTKVRLADSIVFVDKVPPKAAPVKTAFALTDSVKFYFMDNGSGISQAQKKIVVADYDTVGAVYESSIISFENPCHRTCKLKIPIPDNAKNRNTEMYWKLEPGKDSLRISGPFVPKEDSW